MAMQMTKQTQQIGTLVSLGKESSPVNQPNQERPFEEPPPTVKTITNEKLVFHSKNPFFWRLPIWKTERCATSDCRSRHPPPAL